MKCYRDYDWKEFEVKESDIHSRLEIKTIPREDGKGTILTEVLIDGHRINDVREARVHIEAGKIPKVTLDINALDLHVDQLLRTKIKGYGDVVFCFDGEKVEETQ